MCEAWKDEPVELIVFENVPRLAVEDGHLRDYLIMPERRNGVLGVLDWHEHAGAVAGESLPSNGTLSIAAPRRPANAAQYQQHGGLRWGEASGAITAGTSPGQGTFSVADPRHAGPAKHNNECGHRPPAPSPARTAPASASRTRAHRPASRVLASTR
ncbi:hypothetical protein CNECB9_3760112 [Cupriavidus necator]|uniref:DNA (cytosine-5-)-methyltransferase n=1 Tax=Cupriavidus necator TaxID=106590 RepID=A0A1K0IJ91_CUPNE|nr:hypothetical protein CNECB9_3760112 [Cupriavidus necator]